MRRHTTLAVASLTVWALASLAHAEPASPQCKMREIGELAVDLSRGVPSVDAKINGHSIRMIVDTGSSGTTISHEAAEKLGLTVKVVDYVTMYGTDGQDRLGEVGVKEFTVGPFMTRNSNMAVVGRGHQSIDGVLGIQFFRQADVEFDLAHGKIRFFKAESCNGDAVVYWGSAYSVAPIYMHSSNAMIEVQVKVGDRPIRALMDTGATRSVVIPDVAAKDQVKLTPIGDAEGITGLAKVPTSVGVFDSFSFGDETIKHAKLTVADLWKHTEDIRLGSRVPVKVIGGQDMLLGLDFFRSHRIYISNSQNKVYVSYVGGPVFNTRSTDNSGVPGAMPAP